MREMRCCCFSIFLSGLMRCWLVKMVKVLVVIGVSRWLLWWRVCWCWWMIWVKVSGWCGVCCCVCCLNVWLLMVCWRWLFCWFGFRLLGSFRVMRDFFWKWCDWFWGVCLMSLLSWLDCLLGLCCCVWRMFVWVVLVSGLMFFRW